MTGRSTNVRTSDVRPRWVDGLAEWTEDGVAYLSVAFTWKLNEARDRAQQYASYGYRVVAGGPALFLPSMRKHLQGVADIGAVCPDAVKRHHPWATIASRGCPVNCWFCTVPKLWGTEFTLIPEFPVRPILCDDNLSALPIEYQRHIIERYVAEGVTLLDANSGFEPQSFDGGTFERWSKIMRGPWRFGYDEVKERGPVQEMMKMLRLSGVKPRNMRVYCMIGHEPIADCLQRIEEIVAWGGEPYVQRNMKLNALEKVPWIRHDWTSQSLAAMARWANRRIWRYAPYREYDGSIKTSRRRAASDQMMLL